LARRRPAARPRAASAPPARAPSIFPPACVAFLPPPLSQPPAPPPVAPPHAPPPPASPAAAAPRGPPPAPPRLVRHSVPALSVLSYSEVPEDKRLKLVGTIS
ncbi:hypothetical protein CEK65_19625, partial [Xanthomonas sp. LMG 12459]